MFAEAIALGAPTAEIARDRGLAYDMIGDPRRAQQDYALALRRGDDPEVRRRMALSLAISGQRDAALRMIDDQLRRHDRAAWRTQAFVLALTGDARRRRRHRASRMMPAGAAQAMAPFFARLAALSPAQKAMAVHFGHFPSDGRAIASTGVDTGADPGALALAQGEAPAAMPRPREPMTEARDPRRRPGAGARPREPGSVVRRPREEIAPPVRRPVEVAQAETRRFEPPAPEPREPPPKAEPRPEPPAPDSQASAAVPEPEPEPQAPPEPEPDPVEAPPPSAPAAETAAPAFAEAAPGFTLSPAGEQPRLPPAVAPAAAPATAESDRAAGLGDLASVLQRLPDPAVPPAPARAEPRRPPAAEQRPAPQRQAARAAGAARPSQPPLGAGRGRRQPGGAAGDFRAAARARRRPARRPRRLYDPAQPDQPAAGRAVRQQPRGAGLRQPARRTATSRHLPGQARRARR